MRADNSTLIFHLCPRAAWDGAPGAGVYRGLEEDRWGGFLHFSTAAQVRDSADRHRADVAELAMLTVDGARLGDALKWEKSHGGALFPHLYGPLPLSAVLRVDMLRLGPDRRHRFPDWLIAMEPITSG